MRMKLVNRCYFYARRSASRFHSGAALSKQQQQAVEDTWRPHVLTTTPGEAAAKTSTIRKDMGEDLGRGLLTRDFIAKSLYNQENGYFSTKDVINDLPGPLEFGSMMGELHYRLDVKKVNSKTFGCGGRISICGNSPNVRWFPNSTVVYRVLYVDAEIAPLLLPNMAGLYRLCCCCKIILIPPTPARPLPRAKGLRIQAVGMDDSSGNLLPPLFQRAGEVHYERDRQGAVSTLGRTTREPSQIPTAWPQSGSHRPRRR